MRKSLLLILLLSCRSADDARAPEAASPTTAAAAATSAELGKPAPEFTLKDLDGKDVRLSDFKGKVVVLEWFNPECPFVRLNHTQGPLKTMAKDKRASGVVWLSINSAAPGKQGSGVEKSRDGMKRYAMENPILIDDGGAVGHAYGAKTTPHMFVIDASGVLRYRGAIDNAQDGDPPGGQKFVNYVDAALADIGAGRAVAIPEVPSYGCSVKY